MDALVINFKTYNSGSMIGFFDLSVCGLVVCGCKAFRKEERLWFAWPAEKSQDRDGKDQWRDIVTAAEPVMRQLQSQVRDQLRIILDGGKGSAVLPSAGRPAKSSFRTPEGEDLSQYRSSDTKTGIPF